MSGPAISTASPDAPARSPDAVRRAARWAATPPDRRLRRYRLQHRARLMREARNPEAKRKRQAREALRQAVHDGRVRKPTHCQLCRRVTPAPDLHGHHAWGYARENALRVRFLCLRCHRAEESWTTSGAASHCITYGAGSSTSSSGGAR